MPHSPSTAHCAESVLYYGDRTETAFGMACLAEPRLTLSLSSHDAARPQRVHGNVTRKDTIFVV